MIITFELITDLKNRSNQYNSDRNYCIDDLIEQKFRKIKITQAKQTEIVEIILIVIAILFTLIIAIIQFNVRRIYRFAKQFLPESELYKFRRQYQLWNISRQLIVDYNRCIGVGEWSKLYFGRSKYFVLNKAINVLFLGNLTLRSVDSDNQSKEVIDYF